MLLSELVFLSAVSSNTIFGNKHISGAVPPVVRPPGAKPQGSLLGGPPGMMPGAPMGPMPGPVGPMMGMPAPVGMMPPGSLRYFFYFFHCQLNVVC